MSQDFVTRTLFTDSSCMLTCRGELDLATTPRLVEAAELCLARGPSEVVLDLTGISLMTSSGIETLVGFLDACEKLQIPVDLRLSPHVRRILDLVGLWWVGVVHDGFNIQAELGDALQRYGSLAPRQRRDDTSEALG